MINLFLALVVESDGFRKYCYTSRLLSLILSRLPLDLIVYNYLPIDFYWDFYARCCGIMLQYCILETTTARILENVPDLLHLLLL